ncbi:hypothetical protein Q0P09_15510, partial [Staphylococcus aureus]|nr:hypothetical protein [Staphylococcus aureus]
TIASVYCSLDEGGFSLDNVPLFTRWLARFLDSAAIVYGSFPITSIIYITYYTAIVIGNDHSKHRRRSREGE